MAFVVGIVYGTAATVGQGYALGWFPLGLLLAVIGSGALILALRLLTGDRWVATAGGLGIVAATVLFTQPGLGGSAIVAAQTAETQWVPIAWTLAVPVMLALVIAWPDMSALRALREPPPADPT